MVSFVRRTVVRVSTAFLISCLLFLWGKRVVRNVLELPLVRAPIKVIVANLFYPNYVGHRHQNGPGRFMGHGGRLQLHCNELNRIISLAAPWLSASTSNPIFQSEWNNWQWQWPWLRSMRMLPEVPRNCSLKETKKSSALLSRCSVNFHTKRRDWGVKEKQPNRIPKGCGCVRDVFFLLLQGFFVVLLYFTTRSCNQMACTYYFRRNTKFRKNSRKRWEKKLTPPKIKPTGGSKFWGYK